MKYVDVAALSISNMRGRKLRAWLTVLGIVIAVASIITLISLANGVNQQVSSRLNLLGNDVIQITPGASRSFREGGGVFIGGGGGFGGGAPGGGAAGTFGGRINQGTNELKFSEAEDLKLVEGVLAVDVRLQGSKRASFKGRNASVQIVGIDPAAFNQISTTTLLDGKLLNPSDRYSIMLGYRVHSQTFEGEELLNRQMKIGDYYFRVVGLLNQTSGSLTTSDSVVYVPIEVAKTLLNESENANQVFVKVQPGSSPDEVAARIETKLLDLHRLTPDKADFTITTASFLQSTVSDVTNMLALFLGGIAAISLLVGAIGVANTMFMSVLERTREIGILKSLGMKDSEVTAMFLTEAAIIGVAGGTLGIALSLIVSNILAAFSVPSLITADLMAGSLVFSGIVGVASGAIPARNAAKLQPVESLRYE
ncbi:MAG TPA: ABC transporter permease [Candidatus Norongarragalinales archaeon]|nr:ABC transporter permease [Candidatus Norongarragalinales archaeon]